MKKVVCTFFNDTVEDFRLFTKLFEDAGYEVAKSTGQYQGVVITEEAVDENASEQ